MVCKECGRFSTVVSLIGLDGLVLLVNLVVLVLLVDLVILVNLVVMVNLVVLVNLVILVNLVVLVNLVILVLLVNLASLVKLVSLAQQPCVLVNFPTFPPYSFPKATTPSPFIPSISMRKGCSKRTCLTYCVSSMAGMASRISLRKRPSGMFVSIVK